ncbi:hypothetical protein SODG_003341 [Sodalis praecaptivus]
MESRYAFRPFWACLAVVLAASPCAPTFAAPAAGENPPCCTSRFTCCISSCR